MLANRIAFCSVFLPCHLVYLVDLVLSQPESKKPTLVRGNKVTWLLARKRSVAIGFVLALAAGGGETLFSEPFGVNDDGYCLRYTVSAGAVKLFTFSNANLQVQAVQANILVSNGDGWSFPLPIEYILVWQIKTHD